MELILLEKIAKLGNLGDKVSVKSGYGRNYLVPQGKAVLATAKKLAEFEQQRAELEKKAAAKIATAEARLDSLNALSIEIIQKAGEEGKLFGSVGTQDIADAVTQAGSEIQKHEVRLPEGALRHTGDYQIELQLQADIVATVALKIVAE